MPSEEGVEIEEKYDLLFGDEVLSTNAERGTLRSGFNLPRTFRVEELVSRVEARLLKEILEGVECEAMRLNRPGWQKGKVRVCKIELEFCPDQPDDRDSSLDQIRSSLSDSNG